MKRFLIFLRWGIRSHCLLASVAVAGIIAGAVILTGRASEAGQLLSQLVALLAFVIVLAVVMTFLGLVYDLRKSGAERIVALLVADAEKRGDVAPEDRYFRIGTVRSICDLLGNHVLLLPENLSRRFKNLALSVSWIP